MKQYSDPLLFTEVNYSFYHLLRPAFERNEFPGGEFLFAVSVIHGLPSTWAGVSDSSPRAHVFSQL